ncbi:trypsin-like peptidase domain-containing protein, partial [Candidatus Sumerlaeota bacterium]
AGVLLLGAATLLLSGGKEAATYKPLTQETFINVAKELQPSVVSITIAGINEEMMARHRQEYERRRQQPQAPDPFREFFGDDFRFRGSPWGQALPEFNEDMFKFRQAGSGVVIRPDGYIVTNNHVIGSAKNGEITVTLKNDTKYEKDQVKIIGVDPLTDLAVLKIDAKGLPAAGWAKSEQLQVGQWVLAIGDPLEFRNSVTQGIISAVGRDIGVSLVNQYIQTTAIINPGNSGGALVDLEGNIVGINQAISSRSGMWNGIGFAIPSKRAKKVTDDIISTGKVVRGYIGVSAAPRIPQTASLPQQLKDHFAYDGEGVLVFGVTPDGPANEAGIKANDIIVEIDGTPIPNFNRLLRVVAAKDIGQRAKFKVFREGDFQTVTVKVGERPSNDELMELAAVRPKTERLTPEPARGKLGFVGREHEDPALPSEDNRAIIVEAIVPNSPVTKAQLPIELNDSIYEINGQRVRSLDDMHEALAKNEESALIKLHRGSEKLLSVVKLK